MDSNPLEKLDARLRVLETRNAADAVHRDNVASRLAAIEDTLKWLVRLMLGGLLMSVLGYALQGGFAL
jgi:hypothetical protein